MDEASKVEFAELSWSDEAPGIRSKEATVEGCRWAIVEYEAEAHRDEWCEDGHRGYVLQGDIQYEFDDERTPLRASAGEAFRLPPARRRRGAHRGRNLSLTPTRLFLIDEPSDS